MSSIWPANIPPLSDAISLLSGAKPPPGKLFLPTRELLEKLSPLEKAAIVPNEQGLDSTLLVVRQITAVRWRLAAALELKPVGTTIDKAAMETLRAEMEHAQSLIRTLLQTPDPQTKDLAMAAREELTQGVKSFVTPPPKAEVQAASSTAAPAPRRSATQTNLKAAAPSAKSGDAAGKKSRSLPVQTIAIVAAVLLLVGGLGTFMALHESYGPVPDLSVLPPDTQVVGNPQSGSVLVISTNGKPLDREQLAAWGKIVHARGAIFKRLNPRELKVMGPKK